MLRNCWSACTLTETCCYNTKQWIIPTRETKDWGRGGEVKHAFFPRNWKPSGLDPTWWFCRDCPHKPNRPPPTSQRWSGMKRKVIFQRQALMSQDEGFFQWPESWYLGPRWELWAPPSEAQQFLWFSRSSLANETKAEAWALGVTTDLLSGFSPPVWDVKPQHAGHAPVWITRLGLADFPLPLQLNKVLLQTRCPNLCYAAVGY